MTAQLDLLSALSRLLRSGALRDEFALDATAVASRLRLRPEDRASFTQLAPRDVEFQARVLLRKRFRAVALLIPGTCALLGDYAWARFGEYARTGWPVDARHDALDFGRALRATDPALVDARELHRVAFSVSSRRWAVHLLREPRALQVLVRFRASCSEWMLTAWSPAPRVVAA